MGMPCHGGFPLPVSSAAFLRNAVLIPGGVGLSPCWLSSECLSTGWAGSNPAAGSRAVISHFLSLWPQLIVEQQDEQLELVSGSIGVLKNMSQRIGGELEEQAV